MNIKKIVRESVTSYIRNIIREDYGMEDAPNPKMEFINGLNENNITLYFGSEQDFEFETENFFFHVNYEISSRAYYDKYSSDDNSFEDEYTIHDDDIEFNELTISFSDVNDDGELEEMDVDDEIENELKKCQINWDDYDMESYDDIHFGEYNEEF